MIPLPKEVIGVLINNDDGELVLKDEATEEQRKIFEKFKRDLESGKLTDVIVEYEE